MRFTEVVCPVCQAQVNDPCALRLVPAGPHKGKVLNDRSHKERETLAIALGLAEASKRRATPKVEPKIQVLPTAFEQGKRR